jgi:hypothetical protein
MARRKKNEKIFRSQVAVNEWLKYFSFADCNFSYYPLATTAFPRVLGVQFQYCANGFKFFLAGFKALYGAL